MHKQRQIYVFSREDIDPELQEQQNAWVELLLRRDIPVSKLPHLGLSDDQKEVLAAMWFRNGLAGVAIGYPQTTYQLWCYVISSSQWWIIIFSATCLLHTCAPFLTVPECPWEISHTGQVDVMKPTNGYWPHIAVIGIYICAALVYMADVAFGIVVNRTDGSSLVDSWNKLVEKNRWLLFRMVICCVVLADIFSFFAVHRSVRFSACLAPIAYITRRTSMQRILEGMFISLYKSSLVYGLYFAILVFYSFLGFVVFQSVDVNSKVLIEDNNGFGKYQESLMTVLLSMLSRSYNLQSLALYFVNTPWSVSFFTSLIIVGDIFTSNLIIAVGNRQFRLFAARVFQRQLGNRKQAMVAIHELLSSDNGMLSREKWLGLCRHISGKTAMSDITADSLFELECELQCLTSGNSLQYTDDSKAEVDCIGFFRLCALLGNDIEIDVDNVPRTFAAYGEDTEEVNDKIVEANIGGENLSYSQHHRRERKYSNDYEVKSGIELNAVGLTVDSGLTLQQQQQQQLSHSQLAGSSKEVTDDPVMCRDFRAPSREHVGTGGVYRPTRKESFDDTPSRPVRGPSFNTEGVIRVTRKLSNQQVADADWSANFDEGDRVCAPRMDTGDSTDALSAYRVRRHISQDKTPYAPPVSRNATGDSVNTRNTYILSRATAGGPMRASFSWAFTDYNQDATLERPPGMKGSRKESPMIMSDDLRTKSVSVNTHARRALQHFFRIYIPALRSDVYDLVEYRLHTAEIPCIRNLGCGCGEFITKKVPQIHVFALFFNIIRVLIAVKVGFLSLNDSSAFAYHAWRLFGSVMLGLMWVEMLMLMTAYGFTSYIRRTGFGYVFAINVIALVLKIMNIINNRPVHERFTTTFYAALVVDCLRFIRFFAFLPGATVFMHILPLVLRIVLIIFSVIFFFSVFANMRFCNSLDSSVVRPGSDAAGWLNHEGVISFDTIGLSILAMFEVAVLGNWTPLMSAVAEEDMVESKVFFVLYRAVMAQVVIPLLIAFVISAFISKRDSDEKKNAAAADSSSPQDDMDSESDISAFKFYTAYKRYTAPPEPSLSDQLQSTGAQISMVSPGLSSGLITRRLKGGGENGEDIALCPLTDTDHLTKAAMKLDQRQHSTTSMQHSSSSLTDLRKSESRFGQLTGNRFPIAPGASNTTSSNMMAMWGQSGGVSLTLPAAKSHAPDRSQSPKAHLHGDEDRLALLQAKLDAAMLEINDLKKKIDQGTDTH